MLTLSGNCCRSVNRKGWFLTSKGRYQLKSNKFKSNQKTLQIIWLAGFWYPIESNFSDHGRSTSLRAVFLCAPAWKCKPGSAVGAAVSFSGFPYKSKLLTVPRKTKPRSNERGLRFKWPRQDLNPRLGPLYFTGCSEILIPVLTICEPIKCWILGWYDFLKISAFVQYLAIRSKEALSVNE